jgi:hypothetical protein
MKRFFSLFLVVNILACYGGFYRNTFASTDPARVKPMSGCHLMNHENNKPANENSSRIINDSANTDSPCCSESLTNTHPDLNAKIEIVSIDRTQPAILNNGKDHLKKQRDNSLREHDPPDLQISNSTFLL